MTDQMALDRIEELLRFRANQDPRAKTAWEAITTGGMPYPLWCVKCHGPGRALRDISDLPEGAVWGLLEHDVCDAMEWETDYWLLALGAGQARIFHHRGSPWHSGATRNDALAAAIIAELEE